MNQLINSLYNKLLNINIEHDDCFEDIIDNLESNLKCDNQLKSEITNIIQINNKLVNDIEIDTFDDDFLNENWDDLSENQGTFNNLLIEDAIDIEIGE